MALLKQRKDESDADYAARLEEAKRRKRERDRERYQANSEAVKERVRNYYRANKEAVRKQKREYSQKNREAINKRECERYHANKEAINEKRRNHYRANIEAVRKRDRERREARTLASAKGKPLTADFRRAHRPKMLSLLIVKVAEDFCRNYGFPLECKWDTDVLVHAAQTIRNSPELYDAANPWYGTDFLCPALLGAHWARNFRRAWRDKE